MLIALVFLLSPVTASSQQTYRNAFRRSRQLDLGLQDISYTNEKAPTTIRLPSSAAEDVINGYLPPVSSSVVPPKVVAAQSQQSFEFKSVNAVEKGGEVPKFEVEHSFSGLNISKPSRDLVPPFNDIELEALGKSQPTLKDKVRLNAETKTVSVFDVPSTSTSPKSKKLQKVPETTTAGKVAVADKAEATNDFRSYLPPQPEIAGAAQTSVAVVQRPNQSNDHDHDHHHHHHHHHEHGDICADAFHSFLCAALKPRKRITGALPPNLRGQSSFVQYQKVLPNFEREPAPSNTLQNQYLPPRTPAPPSPSASNTIQSTYPPPRTTKKFITTTTTTTPRPYFPPKINPEPSSSNDRFYLPPLTDNRIFPAPSNQAVTSFKPPSTTQAPLKASSSQYSGRVNEVRPTEKTKRPFILSTTTPTPSTFLRQETQTVFPKISTVFPLPSNEDRFYLPPNPNPQPAASFVSTTKNFYPTSTIIPQSSVFISSPTVPTFVPLPSSFNIIPIQPKIQPLPIIVSTTVLPPVTVTKLAPQPTISPVFVTSKPTFRPVPIFAPLPSNPSESYLPPQPKFQSASNLISTTVKPITTTTKKPTPTTTPKLLPQPSAADNSYLPPDPNVQPAAAQIDAAAVAPPQVKNPFHHGRDLCTDPFHSFLCVAAKPRKRITGGLPSGSRPEGTSTNELRLKPAPSFQNENRIKPEKPLEGSQSQPLGYQYPKPLNPFPSNALSSTVSPSTGYSYPKPDKIFPLPSQQKEFKFTTPKPTTTKKPEPIVLRTSEARVVTGYDYPKPEQKFPLPSQPETTRIPTPSTGGYSYPKPLKPFPLPTEQKEVRYTTQKPVTTASPSSSIPSIASPTNQLKGYQYPKPEQSLKLPEKKGYSYPKPEKRLELPTETRAKTLLPQSNSNLEAIGNLGSAEFIPVNKLDSKREDSTNLLAGYQRFGERLKKREKRPSD